MLFAHKKDDRLRMVLDYRALNAVTVKNRYPLPRIDDLPDQLQGDSVFSYADMASGYYQIRIQESDVQKTAFNTHLGLYEWKVLPMGLANSPSIFKATMNRIFGDMIGKCLLVYLDDMLIYSRREAEHMQHVRMVLERLRNAKLFLKDKKCHWLQSQLLFWGMWSASKA